MYMVESMFFLLLPYKLHLMSDLRVNDGVMSWNGSLVKTFERKPCEMFPLQHKLPSISNVPTLFT